MVRQTVIDSEIGPLTLVADGAALTGLYYPGHWTKPDPAQWGERVDDDPVFATTTVQLSEYFAGGRTAFEVPIATRGGEFQERVWALLRRVPYGATTTYGAIAADLGGGPSLARAVGTAVGSNPISIIVPCHRVVGANGSLTGYAGGLARKKHLLALEEPEAAAAERLF